MGGLWDGGILTHHHTCLQPQAPSQPVAQTSHGALVELGCFLPWFWLLNSRGKHQRAPWALRVALWKIILCAPTI